MPPSCSRNFERNFDSLGALGRNRNGVKSPSLFLLLAGAIVLAGCDRRAEPTDPATREAVWAAIQPHAVRYRIDASFIYALVAAESNFEVRARNGDARGLMQLKPGAWRTVSSEAYEPAVWNWRKNLETGIEYLAWCRHTLQANKRFSYPVLLASYHYGLDRVAAENFDLDRFPVPDNPIYRELWRGHLAPVPPPGARRNY